ncbi:MAG: IS91 family transposase [Bacteroidota bacterium]|nr:IS91 family transposase [Bacteroidota bacterium]
MKPKYEISDILDLYGFDFKKRENLPSYKIKVLENLEYCRTSYFGGHVEQCDDCGHLRISYNSCRNRHCPKCQGLKKEQWIISREEDLLPVKYFHVVFTLPHELNGLILKYQKELYNLLFKTVWSVIQGFAKNKKFLGAKSGMITILHTWGQNLSFHPHLHCIIPGGGLDENGNWKNSRSDGKYLFPTKAMSSVYRARFVEGLRNFAKEKNIILSKKLIDKLFEKDWVVYAKRPFNKVNSVIEYLGRYTHRIAISNHRIIDIKNGVIKFWAKNYKKEGNKEIVKLPVREFLRRFCLHILPRKFIKIRHYGFLSNRNKKKSLEQARKSLDAKAPPKKDKDWKIIMKEKYGVEPDICPKCKKGKMLLIIELKRGQEYYPLE